MFIKHVVPIAVIPQHTGQKEVLRAGGIVLSTSGEQEEPVTSNNYNKKVSSKNQLSLF